jgi:hypothetical protein
VPDPTTLFSAAEVFRSGLSSEGGHEWWVSKDCLEGGDPGVFQSNICDLTWNT